MLIYYKFSTVGVEKTKKHGIIFLEIGMMFCYGKIVL